MTRLLLLLSFLAFATTAPRAAAGDDMRAVTAVWSDFVSSLRRGDYRNAHALFSPESRAAMPYAEFVAEYAPLSSAREMVLAAPESQATTFDEDWAEITYGGVNPGTGRRFKVGVSLVRNHGTWGLVAARNEAPERVEAQARGVLRVIAAWRGVPEARRRLDELLRANAGNPLFRYYRFDGDGESCRAMPLRSGLRAFYVDAQGAVRAVGESQARSTPPATSARVPSAPTPPLPELNEPPLPPPPPAEPRLANGLPELSEPPPFSPFAPVPGEMGEPLPAGHGWNVPVPSSSPSSISPPSARNGVGAVSLPDSIE